MFSIRGYDLDIDVNVSNGVYIMDNVSANGKTRLAKKLQELHDYGEPVDAYIFRGTFDKERFKQALCEKNKLVVLDRYDMYKGEYKEIIDRCAQNAVILVDAKGPVGDISTEYDFCEVVMSGRRIEVV